MRTLRSGLLAVVFVSLAACGGSDAGSGDVADVVVATTFETSLGAPRSLAWTTTLTDADLWALSAVDDAYFMTADSELRKRNRGPATDPPLWRLTIPTFDSEEMRV